METMQNRIEDFHLCDTYDLDEAVSKEFEDTLSMRIFTHNKSDLTARTHKKSNGIRNKSDFYVYSRFHRILPEDLQEPLMARRIRTFIPGYDYKTRQGYTSGDHIIGAARLYHSSRPHFIIEVDYLRPKKAPMRYFYEFIPHRRELHVAQLTAETAPLFEEPVAEEEQETDIMGFRRILEELRQTTNGENQYREGMRNSENLPGGMKFAWPVLGNTVVVEHRYTYQRDLPF